MRGAAVDDELGEHQIGGKNHQTDAEPEWKKTRPGTDIRDIRQLWPPP